jgi:hypothetical protein
LRISNTVVRVDELAPIEVQFLRLKRQHHDSSI